MATFNRFLLWVDETINHKFAERLFGIPTLWDEFCQWVSFRIIDSGSTLEYEEDKYDA